MRKINGNRLKVSVCFVIAAVFTFITLMSPADSIVYAAEESTGTYAAEKNVAEADTAADTAADETMAVEQGADSWRYTDGEIHTEGTEAGSNDDIPVLRGAMKAGMVKKGIDVSAWQGKINWAKVKAAGIDFAILRCGYGTNKTKYDDTWFKRNASECERLGIPYGVYLYSYADTIAEAKSEAAHVLRLLNGCKLSYPVYYDLEDKVVAKAGKTAITNMAVTFCNIIDYNGYKAGIYANLSWWNEKLNSTKLDKYDKWVAQWNSSCTYKKGYRLWQYTSSGQVAGIEGRVDMNYQKARTDNETYMSGIGTTKIVAPVTNVSDYYAVVTAAAINYRTGPGTGYLRKGQLPKGSSITITHTANGWGKIKSNGCWVVLSAILKYDGTWIESDGKTVFQKIDGTIAVSQWVKYKECYYYVDENGEKLTGFQTIGSAKYYLGTDGIARSARWVTYSGNKYYLVKYGKLAIGYKKIGNYYYGFNSNGAMLKGTVILGDWRYRFSSDGKAYLFTAKTKTSLNYRTGPSTKYKKIGTYKKKKVIAITRQYKGWGRMSNGYWIKLTYTTKATKYPQLIPYKVKTTGSLNYRKGPGTSYAKKGTYKKDTVVTIKSLKNGWGKMTNGYWIKLSYTVRVYE